MEDITDNLVDNEDLLGILEAGNSDKSLVEQAIAGEASTEAGDTEDEEEISKSKLQELKDLASELTYESGGSGSGDLDVDLSKWFSGEDILPSEPLKEYERNAEIKMDYGLCRNTLSNFGIMGNLRKFLGNSAEILFNADNNALMSIPPDELMERVKIAFTIYEKMYNMNQKTLVSIKDYKIRSKGLGMDDNDDKLRLLLSSISSDKLKAILAELNK